MTEWIQTDDFQWQRMIDNHYVDDTYEMYQMVEIFLTDTESCYFAGGGTFELVDYKDDIDYCITTYGYDDIDDVKRIYGDDWEGIVAECVFECNFADFPVESFDTEKEALAFVSKCMQ